MDRNEFEQKFELGDFFKNEEIDFRENSTHYILPICPNCDGKDKFFIDKKTKLWVCYRCCETNNFEDHKNGRGNFWTLLLLLGFEKHQIQSLYSGREILTYTGDFEIKELGTKEVAKIDKVDDFEIPQYLIPLDRSRDQMKLFFEAYKYLWDRNVRTAKQYLDFNLMYDHQKKRIIFPAYTINGKCIGIQSRDITNRYKDKHPKCINQYCPMGYKYYFLGETKNPILCPECGDDLELCHYPKSINSRGFPKTEFFFNEQNVDWSKTVTLVEGPFDCINTENSIAFLGKVLSETQLNILIKNLKGDLILYLDGDDAGVFSTKQMYEYIRPFFNIKIVHSLKDEDPGMFELDINQERIKNAIKPYKWFKINNFNYM